jgi:hypothetical protein
VVYILQALAVGGQKQANRPGSAPLGSTVFVLFDFLITLKCKAISWLFLWAKIDFINQQFVLIHEQ